MDNVYKMEEIIFYYKKEISFYSFMITYYKIFTDETNYIKVKIFTLAYCPFVGYYLSTKYY